VDIDVLAIKPLAQVVDQSGRHGSYLEIKVKRQSSWRSLLAAGAVIFSTAGASLNAHDVSYPDEQEADLLATNIDKAIQACGIHAAAFGRTNGEALAQKGISLSDQAPDFVKVLASPSTLGASRYHRWLDPHAEIWLIASKEKPACRVGISNSKWVGGIGRRLAQLVQVGNYWRPAMEGQSPIGQIEGGPIHSSYIMDIPKTAKVRPLLSILAARSGTSLSAGQQMIVTVLMLSKTDGDK
jgi:hypothetical protein